jgi:prepilin-type N-terminal cleavage/methylation domain-containing protein
MKMARRSDSGFTLIEVLVALTIFCHRPAGFGGYAGDGDPGAERPLSE